MKFKIFQPYYNEQQRAQIDPGFEPFDNLKNPMPELREYYINLMLRDVASSSDLDLWGNFSPRWKEKLSGYTSADVIERINQNPGYDVYFFNGFIDQVLQSYNVWEQGVWHHTHLIKIMEETLPIMGIDPAVVYQPMGRDVAFYACYCVATKEFWNGYLELVTKFLDCMPLYPLHIQNLVCSPSNYDREPTLWYFPFIQERLFSTYLLLNAGKYNVLPYHHNEDMYTTKYGYLLDLKDRAIASNSKEFLEQWRLGRNSTFNWPDHCKDWIVNFKKDFKHE
jgi:hypothetical protein